MFCGKGVGFVNASTEVVKEIHSVYQLRLYFHILNFVDLQKKTGEVIISLDELRDRIGTQDISMHRLVTRIIDPLSKLLRECLTSKFQLVYEPIKASGAMGRPRITKIHFFILPKEEEQDKDRYGVVLLLVEQNYSLMRASSRKTKRPLASIVDDIFNRGHSELFIAKVSRAQERLMKKLSENITNCSEDRHSNNQIRFKMANIVAKIIEYDLHINIFESAQKNK